MKWLLLIFSLLLTAFIGLFIQQGQFSQQGSAPGLLQGRLAPCPASPNCINSEFPQDTSHYAAPLLLPGISGAYAISKGARIISTMGGNITQKSGDYLSATFTSTLFRFVDDVELRWDGKTETLHIRSASRVGYGDMSVNQQRINDFMRAWQQETTPGT